MARSRDLAVRGMLPADMPRVGEIFHAAFNELYRMRGFGPVVADALVGLGIADAYRDLDPGDCLVVTAGGRVVGSAFLHVRGSTAGVGPVTVDPRAQGLGAGYALMQEICRRADRAGVRSLRLIQDAFNEASFALYARVGFVAREILVRGGFPSRAGGGPDGVRGAHPEDVPAIVEHERRLLGIERPKDWEMLLRAGDVLVSFASEGGVRGVLARIVRGGVAVLGPGLAASSDDLHELIRAGTADLAARTDTRLLVPARLDGLLERLRAEGLRLHSLCTYMVRGEYEPFRGAYVPTLFPESG